MTGRRVEVRATMHSISCSRLERERIRALADREGVSMSKLLVDRALKRNPPPKVRNPPRLVLSEEEQRTLVETVKATAETVRALRVRRRHRALQRPCGCSSRSGSTR